LRGSPRHAPDTSHDALDLVHPRAVLMALEIVNFRAPARAAV